MRFRILFISGCPDDARRLSQMLHSVPLQLDHAATLQQARNMLGKSPYRVILTEASLPDATWMDVVRVAELPVIVTDPQADARLWSEVLNRGGYDLLTQPFYAPEVRRILGNAVSRPSVMTAV
jgi:DNA-binding NtrC family response regulator